MDQEYDLMAFDNSKWAEFDRNYQKSNQSVVPDSNSIDSVEALLASVPKQMHEPGLDRFIPPFSEATLDPQSA